MAPPVIKRDFTNQAHFHRQTFHVVGRILRVSGSAVKKPFLDLTPEIVDKLSLIREADIRPAEEEGEQKDVAGGKGPFGPFKTLRILSFSCAGSRIPDWINPFSHIGTLSLLNFLARHLHFATFYDHRQVIITASMSSLFANLMHKRVLYDGGRYSFFFDIPTNKKLFPQTPGRRVLFPRAP